MSFYWLTKEESVFLRMPKTASTSILGAGVFHHRKGPEFELQDDWIKEAKHVIVFIRNPYARFFSAMNLFGISALDAMDLIEDDSVDMLEQNEMAKARRHLIPMTHPFNRIETATFVGRFETLTVSYLRMLDELYLTAKPLKHIRRGSYSGTYQVELADHEQRLASIFSKDAETFGYQW